MKIVMLLLAVVLLQGCFLVDAPDVEVKRKAFTGAADRIPTPSDLGIADLAGNEPNAADGMPLTGIVAIDIGKNQGRWTYWAVGASTMVYRPDENFVASPAWDMRVTTEVPLVGSNGGETAYEEGWLQGQAAFAVVSDHTPGFIPRRIAEVTGFTFNEDRYESLEYDGIKLSPELQNSLLNTIGSGLVRRYLPEVGHTIELSHRIFILRAADGVSYYAIRFYFYSRPSNKLAFQWRKLL